MSLLFLLSLFLFSFFLSSSWGATAGLYGLDPSVNLISIDPETAQTTKIGNPPFHELQAQGLSSLDEKNELLYYIGYNYTSRLTQLISVDLNDGTIEKQVTLPFQSEAFVGVGQYCDFMPDVEDVLVTGQDPKTGNHMVYQLVPSTGAYTEIVSIDKSLIDVLGGAHVYDPKNKILWIEYAQREPPLIKIFGIDVPGKQIKFNLTNTENLESMAYDPKTGLVWGFGVVIQNGSGERTLLSLDGATGKIEMKAKFPGYFIIDGNMSALDVQARRLFAYLLPVGSQAKTDLVSVNIDTNQVLSHPQACTETAQCPWSIEYYNGGN